MKFFPFLKYIFALLLFGTNGIIASFIALNSYEIVFLRTGIGSLLLIALFFLFRSKLTFYRHKKQFLCLVISGIAMGASWIFLYEAYPRIGVSIASLLYYCGPILVMALSPLLFHERLYFLRIAGFMVVLGGIFLVNGAAFSGSGDFIGLLCGLLSAVMYAVMVIFNKKATDIQGLENSMLQLFVSFLTAAAFVGIRQGYGFLLQIPVSSIFPILILGLLNTGIGCFLYFSSINHLPVQTVAIVGYLEPLSAVLFSVFFLSEEMAWYQIIGAVLIIGGAIFSEIYPLLFPNKNRFS